MKPSLEVEKDSALEKEAASEKKDRRFRKKFISTSSNFIAAMGLLAFAGYQLDEYYANERYFLTLVGLLLGFTWGMYETIKVALFLNKEQEKKASGNSPSGNSLKKIKKTKKTTTED